MRRRRGAGHGTLRGSVAQAEATLDSARSGDLFEIVGIDDSHARISALRFGVAAGSRARCVTRIPAGPVVIESGRQEIAIGRGLARRIRIRGAQVGSEGRLA